MLPYCKLGDTKVLFILLLIIWKFCLDVLFVDQMFILKMGKYGHMSCDFEEIVQPLKISHL